MNDSLSQAHPTAFLGIDIAECKLDCALLLLEKKTKVVSKGNKGFVRG